MNYYRKQTVGFSKYSPESWSETIVFRLHGFTFKPWFGLTATISVVTFIIENHANWLRDYFSMPMDAHVVMGSALSFLVVFRTNSSYDRWWEARCSWEKVINACRAHATSVASTLRSEESKQKVYMLLIAYCISFKARLRNEKMYARRGSKP